jgi:hypothetical protein
MAVSRDLYLEQGWKLPRGLETPSERNPMNFTLAEWQQAKRQGLDPRWIRQWPRIGSMAFRRRISRRIVGEVIPRVWLSVMSRPSRAMPWPR